MPLESTIVNSILNYLNHKVVGCVAEKVHGNSFQVGRPDINGCWKGRSFRIEVKSRDHGNKPTKIQELNLRKWAEKGAICFVAYCVDDVECVINNNEHYYQDSFSGTIFPKTISDRELLTLNDKDKCIMLQNIAKGLVKYDV